MYYSLWIFGALLVYLGSEKTFFHFSRTARRMFWYSLSCAVVLWLVQFVQTLQGVHLAWVGVCAILAASFVEDEVQKALGLVLLDAEATRAARASLRTPSALGRAERVSDLVSALSRGRGATAGTKQLLARLRGTTLRLQRALHAALVSAPPEELNYALAAVNAPALLEAVADETMLELVGPRLRDLSTVSRAVLVDALQKLGLRFRPARQSLVQAIVLATRGTDLTLLKAVLDDGGDYHSTYKLVYHDLQAEAQAQVLAHLTREGAAVAAEFRRQTVSLSACREADRDKDGALAAAVDGAPLAPTLSALERERDGAQGNANGGSSATPPHLTPRSGGASGAPPAAPPPGAVLKILSDIDDTLFSSGGRWPAGTDARYPRKTFYPGALALFAELDRCWARTHAEALTRTAQALGTGGYGPGGGGPGAMGLGLGLGIAEEEERDGLVGLEDDAMSLTTRGGGSMTEEAGSGPYGGPPLTFAAPSFPAPCLLSSGSYGPRRSSGDEASSAPAGRRGSSGLAPQGSGPGAGLAGGSLRPLRSLPRLAIPPRASQFNPLSPTPSELPSPSSSVLGGSSPRIFTAPGDGGGLGAGQWPLGRAPGGGMLAVRGGRWHQAGSNLTFLSARPESYKGMTEAESQKRYFGPLVARGEWDTSPSMLLGSKDSGLRALLSYFRLMSPPEEVAPEDLARSGAVALSQILAAKKLSRAREYAAIYPEAALLMVGDNGQGDVLCSEVLWASLLPEAEAPTLAAAGVPARDRRAVEEGLEAVLEPGAPQEDADPAADLVQARPARGLLHEGDDPALEGAAHAAAAALMDPDGEAPPSAKPAGGLKTEVEAAAATAAATALVRGDGDEEAAKEGGEGGENGSTPARDPADSPDGALPGDAPGASPPSGSDASLLPSWPAPGPPRQSRLVLTLVHKAAPLTSTFSMLRVPGDSKPRLRAKWAARSIFVHRTHVGMAAEAVRAGLLDAEGLHRVGTAATADFLRVWARYGGLRAGRNLFKALRHLNADLEAASKLLPPHLQLGPVPSPEGWTLERALARRRLGQQHAAGAGGGSFMPYLAPAAPSPYTCPAVPGTYAWPAGGGAYAAQDARLPPAWAPAAVPGADKASSGSWGKPGKRALATGPAGSVETTGSRLSLTKRAGR